MLFVKFSNLPVICSVVFLVRAELEFGAPLVPLLNKTYNRDPTATAPDPVAFVSAFQTTKAFWVFLPKLLTGRKSHACEYKLENWGGNQQFSSTGHRSQKPQCRGLREHVGLWVARIARRAREKDMALQPRMLCLPPSGDHHAVTRRPSKSKDSTGSGLSTRWGRGSLR